MLMRRDDMRVTKSRPHRYIAWVPFKVRAWLSIVIILLFTPLYLGRGVRSLWRKDVANCREEASTLVELVNEIRYLIKEEK